MSDAFNSRLQIFDTPSRTILAEQLDYYGLGLAPYDHDPMDYAIRRSHSPFAKFLKHRPDALMTFPSGADPLAVQVKATNSRGTFSAELSAYRGTLAWNAALESNLLIACVDVGRNDVWMGQADQLPDPPAEIRLPRNPHDVQGYRREYERIQIEHPGIPIRPSDWNVKYTNMPFIVLDPEQLGFRPLDAFIQR